MAQSSVAQKSALVASAVGSDLEIRILHSSFANGELSLRMKSNDTIRFLKLALCNIDSSLSIGCQHWIKSDEFYLDNDLTIEQCEFKDGETIRLFKSLCAQFKPRVIDSSLDTTSQRLIQSDPERMALERIADRIHDISRSVRSTEEEDEDDEESSRNRESNSTPDQQSDDCEHRESSASASLWKKRFALAVGSVKSPIQGAQITLFVRSLTGKMYPIPCCLTDSIQDLKSKIHRIEGTQPDEQRLIFGGRQIEDTVMRQNLRQGPGPGPGLGEQIHSGEVKSTIADWNLSHGSTLYIVLRLRGC